MKKHKLCAIFCSVMLLSGCSNMKLFEKVEPSETEDTQVYGDLNEDETVANTNDWANQTLQTETSFYVPPLDDGPIVTTVPINEADEPMVVNSDTYDPDTMNASDEPDETSTERIEGTMTYQGKSFHKFDEEKEGFTNKNIGVYFFHTPDCDTTESLVLPINTSITVMGISMDSTIYIVKHHRNTGFIKLEDISWTESVVETTTPITFSPDITATSTEVTAVTNAPEPDESEVTVTIPSFFVTEQTETTTTTSLPVISIETTTQPPVVTTTPTTTTTTTATTTTVTTTQPPVITTVQTTVPTTVSLPSTVSTPKNKGGISFPSDLSNTTTYFGQTFYLMNKTARVVNPCTVYTEPNTSSATCAVLETLTEGTSVQVVALSRYGTWAIVTTSNNITGFCEVINITDR